MLLKTLYLVLFIVIIINSINGQIVPDSLSQDSILVHEQSPDSTQKESAEKKLPAPKLDLLWYNAHGDMVFRIDSTEQTIYHFDDLLYLNYNGLGDVFRIHPMVQLYDHMEIGLPRYAAAYNLMPQQTAFQVNGWTVNDPIHGMYNMRFNPTDITEAVERTANRSYPAVPGSGLNNGINVSTRLLNPPAPYTRIMFRQGDFGHTDLDITFARQIGSRATIQLSGINKYHNISSYRGQNYHGFLHYQVSPNIQTSLRVNINDEKMRSINESSYNRYAHDERRDEIYLDISKIYSDTNQLDWKILAAATSSDRIISDTFRVENRYDRYQLAGVKHVNITDRIRLKTSVSAERVFVWGNAFQKELMDSRLAGWASLDIPLGSYMKLIPDIQVHYLWDDNLSFAPGISFQFSSPKWELTASAEQYYRFPNRLERSIQIYERTGNNNLKPERLENLVVQGKYRLNKYISFNAEFRAENISDEIRLKNNRFINNGNRKFTVINASADVSFYKFRLLTGGLHSVTDNHLSPESVAWAQLRFSDIWLKGALRFDAIGGINWTGNHNNIYFDPIAQHYYWTSGQTDGYHFYYFKLVATVLDAQFFMVMDNPNSYDFEYIKGYKQYYRRVQFGLNWVMWD